MSALASITEQDTAQAGTIPNGFLFASIKNVGEDNATVNSVELKKGEAKSYPFVGKGYHDVNYDPQSSTLRILYIV